MAERAASFGPDIMRRVEKTVLLQTLDQHWKDHLSQLDNLRQIVGLRAYAQRDPLNEYRTEAFSMFEAMLSRVREQITMLLSHVQLQAEAPPPELEDPDSKTLKGHHIDPTTGEDEGAPQQAGPSQARQSAAEIDPNDPETWGRVPRNAPCPCGSGKKFKHCHGQV